MQHVGHNLVLSHELPVLPVRVHPLPWKTATGGRNMVSPVYLLGLRAAVQRPQWYAYGPDEHLRREGKADPAAAQ